MFHGFRHRLPGTHALLVGVATAIAAVAGPALAAVVAHGGNQGTAVTCDSSCQSSKAVTALVQKLVKTDVAKLKVKHAATASSATTAKSAQTATTAQIATIAYEAVSATTANVATIALTANTAKTATTALTANMATTANTATTANVASSADMATTALSANMATTANTATTASTATHATNSDQLGGQAASSYQPRPVWALVNSNGTIAAQSGGVSLTAASGAGGYVLDLGTLSTSRPLIATPSSKDNVFGTVQVAPCGEGSQGVNCASVGSADNANHVLVQTTTISGGSVSAAPHAFYIELLP
jgi:hypothetical protein